MARQQSIPEKLSDQVIAMKASGLSNEKIAERLFEVYKINTTRGSVQRFFARRRKEIKETAKQIYTEQLAETAKADTEILKDNMAALEQIRNKALQDNEPVIAMKAIDGLKNHVALKMNINGVNDSADEDVSEEEINDIVNQFSEN